MEWLLTHMWMALAGVGLFGILLGWAVRGIMVMSKLHRAIGDKEIAKAELVEARSELDVLLKAQRGEIPVQPLPVAAGGADDVLKRELKDREKRLADLAGELAKSKKELEGLKSLNPREPIAEAVGGAVVGAGAAALVGQVADDSPSLAWRNRHLEARLKELEGEIETLSAAAEEAPIAPAVDMAPVEATPRVEDTVAADKAAWKITYLNQRIAALEEASLNAPVALVAPDVPVEAESVVEAEESVEEDALSQTEAEPDAVDEELARLRWRNRYLEGRLAYFDGGNKSAGDEEKILNPTGLAAGVAAATTAIAAAVLDDDADEDDAGDGIADEISLDIEPADEIELGGEAEFEAGAETEADSEASSYVEAVIETLSDETEVETAEVEPEPELGEDSLVDLDIDAEDGGSISDAILKSLAEMDEAADAEEADEAGFEAEAVETEFGSEGDEAVADDSVDDSADDEIEFEESESETAGGIAFIKPLALDGPVGGQPDDLTVIGGVGPKIQEVLNGLGVYHYDQIAAWTPENVAWIDDHLSFSGRIDREGWVEQALILSGDD